MGFFDWFFKKGDDSETRRRVEQVKLLAEIEHSKKQIKTLEEILSSLKKGTPGYTSFLGRLIAEQEKLENLQKRL